MRFLKVLGSGDAFATGGKYPTSFLVHNREEGFLIDCGASTLVRLKQEQFDVEKISTVILTHFHGDHYGGLPFLLIHKRFAGSERPLTIIGPKGVKEQLFALQEALYPGTGVLLDDLDITFMEFDLEEQRVGDLSIQAYTVTHSPPSLPHGVRIAFNGATLAFSGDTEWDDHLIDLAQGTRVFITECNNYQTESTGHLSYKTILEKKPFLKTEKIYLSHMGIEMLNLDSCEFERLQDGMEIPLW